MPLLMRRRPLLRAAAVGGGAYLMGKRRAEEEAATSEQAAYATQAPMASSGITSDAISQLEQLGKLHEQGVLTDEEFAAQKAKLLGT